MKLVYKRKLNRYKKRVYQYRYVIAINCVWILLIGAFIIFKQGNIREEKIVLPSPPVVSIPRDEYVPTFGPQRVIIRKGDIDVPVEPVGIGKSGNMAVPVDFGHAGWYKYGVEPGDRGTAVIAGHLDNGKGSPGVFYRIKELQKGDEIKVVTHTGAEVSFLIKEVRVVDYMDAPLDEIFGTSTDGVRLNLITCDGTWIPEKKMYSDRLVVFAEKKEDPKTATSTATTTKSTIKNVPKRIKK